MGNMYYKRGKADMKRVCRINLNALIASFLQYIDQYCSPSEIEFVSVRSKPEEPDRIQGLTDLRMGIGDNTSVTRHFSAPLSWCKTSRLVYYSSTSHHDSRAECEI